MKITAILLFFTLPFYVLAQPSESDLSIEAEYTIPFLLTDYNNLLVKGILNGSDSVDLMFHTASSSLTLTKEAVERLSSVVFDEVTHGVKSWGGQSNDSRLSLANTLQIGQGRWVDLPIWEDSNSGQGTDGKFGLGLFENKAVEINFETQTITIHEGLPAETENYEKLPIVFENDNLFVEADCEVDGRLYHNRFLIHSGYSGTVLLDDKFVSGNDIDGKLEIIGEKKLTDSFGNVLTTKKVVLPAMRIGGETLTDVPAGYFQGAIGAQKMSVIGGEILKRFNLIIDSQRQFIFLKPNRFQGNAYSNI